MDGFREAVKMMHSLMHLRCTFSAGSRFLRLEILPKSLISNWSQWSGLNRRPTVYETVALPLSYTGVPNGGGKVPTAEIA